MHSYLQPNLDRLSDWIGRTEQRNDHATAAPLAATLLMDLLRREMPEAAVKTFAFRAAKPLFDIAPFSVNGKVESDGKTVRLWARDAEGWLAMDATATIA